jgi:integrating conjugative element protein (TIGR03756 family)
MNKINKIILLLIFSIFAFSTSTMSFAEGSEINTIDLVKAVISGTSHCLHYRITGACFWLDCDWSGCDINTTLKVDHYVPDSVVTVFHKYSSNPWVYANDVIDPVAQKAGQTEIHAEDHVDMGTGDHSVDSRRDNDNRFKEVDVIGNPAAWALHWGVLIPSQATSYFPYYSSMADAIPWRSGVLEILYPGALIPGKREMGNFPYNVWGNIFPRTGFIDQPADAKAAAVIAQRAVDIATNSGQPHFYHKLPQDCGTHCSIDGTRENNDDTRFQMIYPKSEDKCVVFGENDTFSPMPWHGGDVDKSKGNYAWLMWRHYHGCIQGDGRYIGTT